MRSINGRLPLLMILILQIARFATGVTSWFFIVLMSLEMAATTPPFGLLLFIMLGMVKGTTLFQVAAAALPFLFCDLILIIILVVAPGLGLWLPSLMG